MRNMMSCHGSPSFTWWRRLGNGTSVVNPDFNNQDGTYLARGTLIRTYRVRESLGGRVTARLGVMRHVNNPKFGFLGKGPVSGLSYTSYTDFNFRKCNTIRQCSPQVNHLFSPCLALVPGLNVPHTHTQDFTLYGYVMPQRRIRRQPSDPLRGSSSQGSTSSTVDPLAMQSREQRPPAHWTCPWQPCTGPSATAGRGGSRSSLPAPGPSQ